MKFQCTKENFAHALNLVSSLSGKHLHLPILMNVLIVVEESKVELIATNLEVAVRASLRAKVETTGSFTVPAKTLSDVIHLLRGEQVNIELEENELRINSGQTNTKIKGANSDEYPVLPDIEETHAYTIPVESLKEGLTNAVTAVAKNEIRPELAGLYVGFFTERYKGLILAATDSYRLAEARVDVKQGTDSVVCIVPARTVFEMIRLLAATKNVSGESDVRLWVGNNQIAMRYDGFEMTSRLIEGKYPEYSQIIPNAFKSTAIFPVDIMVNTIKAASLFTTIGVNAVAFDVKSEDKTLSVSSTSAQTGEYSSTIEAEITGEENSILLNHRYVLDGLQHLQENVQFGMNSADSPCIFQQKDSDRFLYIVMPIRQ